MGAWRHVVPRRLERPEQQMAHRRPAASEEGLDDADEMEAWGTGSAEPAAKVQPGEGTRHRVQAIKDGWHLTCRSEHVPSRGSG